jgi:peptidoglycan hydrolase CwlO-like protein
LENKGSDLKETIIISAILLLIGGLITLMFFLFRTIVNNALSYVKDQMADLLREVGDITDRLSKNMSELSQTIKENQKEQVKNQTDIAGMKSDIKSHGKNLERLEDKVDKHIEHHIKE